ncbi:Putative polyol transporter 2 [Linum perenne]
MALTKYSVALSLVALLPFFHLGCDVAVLLSADAIRRDLGLTDKQHNHVVNIARGAAIVAAVVAGFGLNFIGRRGVIVIGLFVHTIGALFTSLGSAYQVVITGRVLMGIGFGSGLTAGPIYVAEIAPARHRGRLVSLCQLLLLAGELLGYSAQYLAQAHLSTHASWRVVTVIGAIPTVLIAVFIPFFFDESPCWLVVKGKLAEATAVMEKCGATVDERRSRLDQLKYVAGISPEDTAGEVQVASLSVIMRPMWVDVIAPTIPVFLTLAYVAALQAFAPLSGADVALWFTRIYIEKIGSGSLQVFLYGDMFGVVVRILVSFFPIIMVDIIGRGWVLRISLFFTLCATAVYGGFGTAGKVGVVGQITASEYCFAMGIALQVGYSLGLGTLPWVCGPESFDFRVRGPMVGLAVATNQMVISTVLASFVRWYVHLGVGGIFLIFTGVMVIAFIGSLFFCRDRHREVLIEIVIPPPVVD